MLEGGLVVPLQGAAIGQDDVGLGVCVDPLGSDRSQLQGGFGVQRGPGQSACKLYPGSPGHRSCRRSLGGGEVPDCRLMVPQGAVGVSEPVVDDPAGRPV